MKYNGTYLSIANLRYVSFTRARGGSTMMAACSGCCMDPFAQGVRPMGPIIRASLRLHNALRVASVVVPVLAVVITVASGGHAQPAPDLGKWH